MKANKGTVRDGARARGAPRSWRQPRILALAGNASAQQA